jgi:ferrochelatase
LRDSARRAAALAGVARWDTAWQSAGRTPDPWIGPDILQVLRDKRALGVTDVVSCPIGFVSDHLEVLFDIDVEAQGVAREVGLTLIRTASLNDDAGFMALLADVVLEHVS